MHSYWHVKMWENLVSYQLKKGNEQNAYLNAMSYISKYKGGPGEKW